MLMKKIRFSLQIILGFIGFLNMIKFIIEFDISFLSSSLLFSAPSLIFYFIKKYTTHTDGTERE